MADNDITVAPQESGDSVTFVGATLTPVTGSKQTEGEADMTIPEIARTVLLKASGPTIDIVQGRAGDPVAFRAVWYATTLASAFAAARADLVSWGDQRCDVTAQGITFENCILSQPSNRQQKKVNGVWGVSYMLLFTGYPA